MCNFRVGQKVVCKRVKIAEFAMSISFQCPLVGAIYTIRAINDWGGGRVLLRFYELDNSHLIGLHGGTVEPGFPYTYFAPVVERKTDIEIFRAMLNTTPEKVGAQ